MNTNTPLLDFALAAFIGALVGIEREKRKAEQDPSVGGLRTFILIALSGAVAAWLSERASQPWLFLGFGIMVIAVIIIGYYAHAMKDPELPGLTTEVAAILVYLLGGLTMYGFRELSVALAIATSALLAWKEPLKGMVGRLDRDDFYAGLKLLIATFIVLPVLPDNPIDPINAINPHRMWQLVIFISGISLLGYVATRIAGTAAGTALSGLFGGMVSSTAVSLSFARQSRLDEQRPGAIEALAGGLMLSWAVMYIRLLIIAYVANVAFGQALLIPMLTLAVTCALIAGIFLRWRPRPAEAAEARTLTLKNPFSLKAAIRFAVLFTAVTIAIKLVADMWPGAGIYAVAALSGLIDATPITLSMTQFASSEVVIPVAVTAVLLGTAVNNMAKFGLVAGLGAAGLRSRVAVGLLATAVLTAALALAGH
ncbi:MAG: Uncharacterized protein FD129_67 [bacterium]|nr:MAG: Uncharacterized protein FD129_67 [bacterium]